jgi:alpha/beta superfamily hydrolase
MMDNRNFLITKIAILIILLTSLNKAFAQKNDVTRKEIKNIEHYNFKEIDFIDSEDNTKLSGALIFPKTEYSKIVVIVPGSGKDTKNSHYVLAEELLKNGIGVFRFDDRGVGKSGGVVNFSVDQIVQDLYYAFTNIRQIDTLSKKSIGILGHSLGGIATIENYQKGLNPDFMILMATPIEKYGKFNTPQFPSKTNPKIKISAQTVLENLNIPLLFIAGSNDSFFNSEKTVGLINELNNKNINAEIIPGLNHFLTKGTDDWKKNKDYSMLYEINDTALHQIVNWIKNLNPGF